MPAQDTERPPVAPVDKPDGTGFVARLSLGIAGALWLSGDDARLARPVMLGLELGYAVSRGISVVARACSWLPNDGLANEFVGAGAVYHLVAARVYVASALGVSWTRVGGLGDGSHHLQGLAIEADVGQRFPVWGASAFSLGAHFQIGTPWLGRAPDAFTSLLAGVFMAFGLR